MTTIHDVRPVGPRKKPRRILRCLVAVIASLFVIVGVGIGVAALLWPDEVEKAYGDVQISIGQWRAEATGEVPLAVLGEAGGKGLVDQCDGTFTEMKSYEREDVPPVWAAHNNCRGDVILPLELGDEIDLEHGGDVTRYVVVDIRETAKVWVTTEALIGLQGDLALQSCYFGGTDVPMKFVGLVTAEAAP